MWPESSEQVKPLRTGLTTGTCATACCVAAAQALLANKQPSSVEVQLPKGRTVSILINDYTWTNEKCSVRTSTTKDAGDDPDVTHGATIFVELSLQTEEVIIFSAAQGVGTVTREGLVLSVGEPAINPVPRTLMKNHLRRVSVVYAYQGGFRVSVGVENGEQIALKTMNPRLGIIGGLSILGTTGIVRPYSCAAYIASIHQGIDVAQSNGYDHIAGTTGSTSEHAIKSYYDLDDIALIEMGDFVGALLKHLRKMSIKKVSICGGFGKISKLANGHLDLNSRACKIDFEGLATWADELGASPSLREQIRLANTSMLAWQLCKEKGIPLADLVCQKALQHAKKVIHKELNHTILEVWATDRQGNLIGFAGEPK